MFIRRKPLGSRNFRRPGSLGLNLLRGSMSRIQALTIRRMPLFTAPEAGPLTLDEPALPESVVRPDAQPAEMEQPEAFDFEAEEAEFVEESPEEYTPPPQRRRAAAPATQPSPASPVQRKTVTPSQTVKPTSGPSTVARSTAPSTPATKAPDKGAGRPATPDRFPAVPKGELPADLRAIFNLHKSRGFADHLPQPENIPDTPKIDPEAIAREVQRTTAESPDAPVETPSSEPVRVRGRRRSKVMEIIPESTRAAMEAEDARKAKIASQYFGDQAPAHPSASPASATPVQRSPTPPEFEPASQVPEIAESAEANEIFNNEPAESAVETPSYPAPQAVQRETAAYEPMEDAEAEETEVVDESPAGPESAPSASRPAVPSVARPPVQRRPADYSDQADESAIELDADSDDIPMPPPAERSSSLPAVQRSTAQPSSIQRAPEPDLINADDESLDYSDDTDRSLPEQSVDVYEALLSAGMAYEQPSAPSGEPESIPTTIMPPIGRPGQRNKHLSSVPPSTVAAKRDDSAPQMNPPSPADYMQNMQTMIDFPTAQRSLDQSSDAGNYASSDESEAPASEDDESSYQMPSRPRAAPAEAVQRTFAESGGEPEEVDLEVAEPSILDQGGLNAPSPEAKPASRSVQREPAVDAYDQEPGDSYPEVSPESDEPRPTRATRSVQRTPAPRDDMPEVLDLPDSGLQMDTEYAESAPQDMPEIEPPARTDSVKSARRSVQRMPAPDAVSNETYTEDAPATEPPARPLLRHASRGGVQRTPAPEPEEETFDYTEEMGEDGAAIDMPSMPATANTSARRVQRSPASNVSPEQDEGPEQGQTGSQWLTQDVQADLLSLLNLPADTPVQHNPPSNKPATSKSVQRQPAEAPKAVQRAAEQDLAQDMVQRELTSTDSSHVATGSVTSSGSQAPDSQGSAQADPAAVEQMAQQVYRLLRQRLRIERERQNK